nr:hypothetical protein [uncultured Arsenicibacter sp.]
MDNANFRRFFGAFLTILGTFVILFALVAYLKDGQAVLGMKVKNLGEAIVPFLVGLVFFGAGVSLINRT